MKPPDLILLYNTLSGRISNHVNGACAAISLRLAPAFDGELAFYRLVFWAYALVYEAARVPIAFLTSLPPLKSDNRIDKETSALRTFLAHNLDLNRRRDQRTQAFVHRWFNDACGTGTPATEAHYIACCEHLGERLRETLGGAIEACQLLDDPVDGDRLVTDLAGRIERRWDAYRFDAIVARCANRLGDPSVDLLAFRSRHLEQWRRVLLEVGDANPVDVLEQRIEADLVLHIGDVLPRRVRARLQAVAANSDALTAALLLLAKARRLDTMTLRQIVDLMVEGDGP